MARSSNSRGKKSDKMTKVITTDPFRIGFENLLTPEEDDNGTEKFNLTMLFPPDSPSIIKIEDAMFDVMEDAFGPESDWPSGKKDILPEDKFYDAGKKDYPGFKKGWMVLKASSLDEPGVVDADKNEVIHKREVYRGRWARAQIAITTFDNKAKGVTAYLNHVQLLEHDEAFSGRGSAEDAFDKYEMKEKPRSRRSRDEDDEDEDDDRSNRRSRRGRDDDDRDDKRSSSKSRGSRGRDVEDDEDDTRASRRRGRSDRGRDEEDDDTNDRDDRRNTRSRRARDEDDDDGKGDDRPRSRRASRDDEDDDDERPSRRGRGRDDDDGWN